MNQENDCKTVIIGNSSVGKSSIMKRFVEGKFEA
jgi:GTPase SAR1 family protein